MEQSRNQRQGPEQQHDAIRGSCFLESSCRWFLGVGWAILKNLTWIRSSSIISTKVKQALIKHGLKPPPDQPLSDDGLQLQWTPTWWHTQIERIPCRFCVSKPCNVTKRTRISTQMNWVYTPLKPWDTPPVSTSLFLFRIGVLVSLLFCGWWSRTARESTIPSFVTLKNHQENWTLITAGPYDIFSCPQLHVNKTVFPVCKLPWWARTPQPRPQSAAAMAVQMEKGTMWLCIPG